MQILVTAQVELSLSAAINLIVGPNDSLQVDYKNSYFASLVIVALYSVLPLLTCFIICKLAIGFNNRVPTIIDKFGDVFAIELSLTHF